MNLTSDEVARKEEERLMKSMQTKSIFAKPKAKAHAVSASKPAAPKVTSYAVPNYSSPTPSASTSTHTPISTPTYSTPSYTNAISPRASTSPRAPSPRAPEPAVNSAPANSTPVNSTPANSTPANSAPVNSTPVNSAPVNSAPVDPAPVNFQEATHTDTAPEEEEDELQKAEKLKEERESALRAEEEGKREAARFSKMMGPKTETLAPQKPAEFLFFKTPGVSGVPSSAGTFEHDIWSEVNKVRANPSLYLKHFRDLERNYQGKTFCYGADYKRETAEGPTAFKEAVAELERQSALPLIKLSEVFSKSTKDLVAEDGPRGVLPQDQSNSEAVRAASSLRLLRYGRWHKTVSEIICYCPYNAKDVVVQWLVDDGNPQRTNRRALLNPVFTIVGIASGPHSKVGSMVVAAFTADYTEGNIAPTSIVMKDSSLGRPEVEVRLDQNITSAELKTTADGVYFEVVSPPVGNSKDELRLYQSEDNVLTLDRTYKPSDRNNFKTERYSWSFPYNFDPKDVRAIFRPQGQVELHLLKPVTGSREATVVDSFDLDPSSGSTSDQAGLQIGENSDLIQVKISSSKFKEHVSIHLQDNVITFEFKHEGTVREIMDEKYSETVTVKKTLKLPFGVEPSAFVFKEKGKQSVTLVVNKPKTSYKGEEIDIPLYY